MYVRERIDHEIADLRNAGRTPSNISLLTKLTESEVGYRLRRMGLSPDLRHNSRDLQELRKCLEEGVKEDDIAKKFGISNSMVSRYATQWGLGRYAQIPIDDNLLIERYVNQLEPVERIQRELGYGRFRTQRRLKELGLMRTMIETSRARADRRLRENGIEFPIDPNGYPMTKLPEGHKTGRQMRNTLVYVHVLEMEKKLGRPIQKGETIHHIDFDKQNSKISNLYLCQGQTEHAKIHNSLEEVCSLLFKKGIIEFDGKRYKVNREALEEYRKTLDQEESFIPDPTKL